jgi:hypothetical protein
MLIFDDCQTTFQDLASDSTTDSLTFGTRMMNFGYKYILAQLGRPVTEKTVTTLTVASQQYYQLPSDYLFLKSVTVNVGGTPYPVLEEESQDNWNIINATTTQTADIPTRFFIRLSLGVGASELGFYPAPSSPNNIITFVYEATDKDLSQAKYNTGTVTVANGSPTVTGAGTTFIPDMVGRYFEIPNPAGDGLWYKIAGYTGPLVVTLGKNYNGITGGTLSYQIAEAFALPEEMQMLPVFFALQHYYGGLKHDKTEHDKYKALFDEGMVLGMRRHATKSRGGLTKGRKFVSRFAPGLPLYFPGSVST